jgi:outer membrane protein OmpA-like peptidoglycan-associated protein
MKRSWCWRSLREGLRGGLQAAALLSLLSGCSLFGGSSSSAPAPVAGPAAQSATQPGSQPAGAQTYPNLGTVPNQAPATTSSADRQQITSGLVADNQNAAYSDQPVTAQQTGTPVPAPIPAPAPAPAADAASNGTTPAPSAVGQSATNQPAPEPATSQGTTQAPAVQPAATVLPPAPAVSATPLAPPPNPIPPAPAGTAMVSNQNSVVVDSSQLGGSPLPGYPPVPNSMSAPSTLPGYAAAAPYSAPAGAVPVAGQPIAVIFFADASAGLSDRDKYVLHDVYLLQQQQGGRLRVVGHASLHTVPLDPARHDQVNYKLSATRANAVARALIGMGVPDGALSIVAEGSQAPVFYEFMPTGEAANRRVEIYLNR